MPSSVSAASSTSTSATGVNVFSLVVIEISKPRCTRGRSGRWAHSTHTRDCRLISSMTSRLLWRVHGKAEMLLLLHLLRELEGIGVRKHVCLSLHGISACTGHVLWRYHTHVEVLLLGGNNLLLLLLKRFNLLR